MQKKDSCKICLFDSESECSTCDLEGKLICKHPVKERLLFGAPVFFALITSSVFLWFYGLHAELLLFAGFFIVFYLFFFCFFEIKVLCSHCPYYAEDSKILHCFANYGSPKIWKYNPEPMNAYEKTGLAFTFLCVASLFLYPTYVFFANGFYVIALILHVDVISFFVILTTYLCTRCPNFSCPFNRVQDEVADQFLEKNPTKHARANT